MRRLTIPRQKVSFHLQTLESLGLVEKLTMAMVLRRMAAVVAGMIVALVFVVAVELFSAVVHPVPPDFKGTMEEMCLHVERYPHWVLALVVPAWGVTAFASTWTADRVGGRGSALVTGLLLLAAVVFNISMLPYPIWFKISNLLVIPTAIALGSRLPIRRKVIGGNELK